MFEVGSSVDGWKIVSVVHQGSMAVTYAVRRPPDPRKYAMKVLFLREPSFQERLRRAGEVLLSVRHPNLLPIVEVADVDGLVAVVSPFVEGGNLTQWVASDARSVSDVVQVFRRVCQGLRVAHEHGLVHRNLKPQKVLVDLTGRPYIHDFMLGKVVSADPEAAVTQMGTTFGTPQYMAPEQFRGAAAVDQRADVFSLGCILFELLAGRRAFDGTGLMEIYKQVASEQRPRLRDFNHLVPEALEQLVLDLLAADPDRRPASTRDVVARLDGEAELRALVNPSHRTATPVSALTSSREGGIERRAPLDEDLHAPEIMVSPSSSPPVPADQGPEPLTTPATPISVDSRPRMSSPSLITFTDGDSMESIPASVRQVAQLQQLAPPDAPPPARSPTAAAPPAVGPAQGIQPLLLVLPALFVIAMGIAFLLVYR